MIEKPCPQDTSCLFRKPGMAFLRPRRGSDLGGCDVSICEESSRFGGVISLILKRTWLLNSPNVVGNLDKVNIPSG